MSDEREDRPRGKNSETGGAWKDLASSALLVTAVGAILVAGFVLKADRSADSAAPPGGPAVSPPPAIVLGSTISPEPAPIVSPPATPPDAVAPAELADPLFERLALRAAADLGRLQRVKGPWTAQLVVACQPGTVDRLLTASRGAAKLYVLPAEVRGDACFRVCWGSYPSSREAAGAADLPKSLRGRDKPAAVEIAKVTR